MGRPPVRCERSQDTDCAHRKSGFGRQVLYGDCAGETPLAELEQRRCGSSRGTKDSFRRSSARAWGKLQGLRSKPQLDFPAPASICDRHGKLRAGQCHAPRFVTMHKWRFSVGTSLERLLVEPREMVNGTEIKTGSCLVRCCTGGGPSRASALCGATLANASRRSRQTAPRARQTGAWCCLQRAMPIPSWPEAVGRDLEFTSRHKAIKATDGKSAAKQTNISDLRSL